MKQSLLTLFVCLQLMVNAQTVIEADTVFSDAGSFNDALAPAWMLGMDVNATTTSITTFPYAPGLNFAPDIGYVSANNVSTGTITHVFASSESISQVLIWNAYFDFELDHCVQNAQLVFRDESGAEIATEAVTFPISTAANLEPTVLDLPTEILGVKEVDLVVGDLWGGNEISIRRLAYAGNQLTSIYSIPVAKEITVFPNPAINKVTIPVGTISSIEMMDVLGNKILTTFSSFAESTELSWNSVESGIYFIKILSEDKFYVSRIKVIGN